MPYLSNRQLKKLHKYWLHLGVVDASLRSYWRAKLFASSRGEIFHIDRNHLIEIDSRTAKAIQKYKLQFSVRVADPSEAEPWLSENGNILFVFWASNFPSVRIFSGNNPDVV
ncbi:hypothetical protein [Chitinimonas sp. JJ19]|uniref:hypothetical protein n=1 Tax=Chitinimonas sp. JJ19 TaxID=3109352 RepID=UPI003002A0BB